MEARCLRCNNMVITHQRFEHSKCDRCGGGIQRMRFVRLMEGIHPLGKEHNLVLNGKFCYGTYKSVLGIFVIDKIKNTFEQISTSQAI
ncbi:hypothetical protein LX64_04322 [Chitinophaga skermanii]|uniref:Uncharacterized protein n=1 Tax=Chitinophaga skermanii TaxID=331697 RepID=A0A327Q5R3_9BACT|nr:hypothetical protein [Chitinophaga skermanii]RAI99769.1 hypothetical protein LX64_04322 [Chitinophaga skermanii]